MITVILFDSCSKKTEVKGRVYSKYNTPVSGINIRLLGHGSSKYADISEVATTDADGYYFFKFKAKRKYYYDINCKIDSGFTNTERLTNGKSHQLDLKFNY
ncbi:MAG: hypothetical protein V4580_15500 [Bacteroidota bacterium]